MGMSLPELAGIAGHFVRARWRWHTLHGEALRDFQDARARAIVAFAAQHAPFYRAHWAGHDLRDWRTLPTVDKQTMMAHFATFNTRGISQEAALAVALAAERDRDFAPTLDGVTVGLSSGTSGHRGIFLAAPWEQTGWAGVLLARALHRWQGRLRVAFFLRSNSNLYERIGGLVIQFRYFDLMTPLPAAIRALNDLRPHVIVGPPSLLLLLAEAHERGTLRARPDRLISVAEVLEPQDHARLHAIFAAPIHQIYQCTEGLLAISCARGALHIQEDLVAIQAVPLLNPSNGEGKPGRDTKGSEGAESHEGMIPSDFRAVGPRIQPIITDLWRRTQPMVRYRLNDVVQLAPGPCACGSGFRVIAAVEGRSDDCCRFISTDGTLRIFFPDTIRRMILLASGQIAEYQAVQTRPGQLSVHLAVVPGADFGAVAQAVRASVAATLVQYACRPAELELAEGLCAEAPGTKRRRVRCLG
jgi:phenylacetate-coenzyme A ligase PaaK-like adenylate-forming protein